MSMTFPSHVVALPYGENVALWNNHSDVISRHFYRKLLESRDITPALNNRLERFHMLNPSIPNISKQNSTPKPSYHHRRKRTMGTHST